MKLAILTVAAMALACGAASAQPAKPKTTVICLDVSGGRLPAVCNVPGSMIDKSEYLCRCAGVGMPTDVEICPAGVKAPAESLELDRARYAAVKEKHFSLVGVAFKGRPMCVEARDPLSGR
jgi:hypothetical protein